jgi:glycosyltransferase involved in cell wall biosynthesis
MNYSIEQQKIQVIDNQINNRSTNTIITKPTSVILPVYNEALTIERTLQEVIAFSKQYPHFHFIFVNDGSSDATKSIIENAIIHQPHITLINHTINRGKAFALRTGVKYAQDEYICFTDGDLAYSLDHLLLLVEKLAVYEIVIGNRNMSANHLRNFKRKVAGETFNQLTRLILGFDFQDTQAGIKGFRKEVAKQLFDLQTTDNFAFDPELLYIAQKRGYSIGQIPAKVSSLHQQKRSTVNLWLDPPQMLWSLFKIIFNYKTGKYNG